MTRPGIMIAAGGTGGHLFPAHALAEELSRRGYYVDLVTDTRADRFGADFPARAVHHVPSATLRGRSPLALAKLVWTLLRGIVRARALIRKVRPAAVAGFGGYPTVPPLLAARLAGVPMLVHEQNAVMGRANRLLARFATRIGLTFQDTRHLRRKDISKARIVGTPVRAAVLEAAKSLYKKPVETGALSLVVFGGSQGARVFADIVPEALSRLPGAIKWRLKVVQQVRQEDMERVETAYAGSGINTELAPFFPDLPRRMAAAHLVVARAGASTVAELCVLGRPAILVPLPHSLDNDQLENATRLEEDGAAFCVEQSDFTPERLCSEINRLADEPVLLAEAAQAARGLGQPDAVARLADVMEELARKGIPAAARAGG